MQKCDYRKTKYYIDSRNLVLEFINEVLNGDINSIRGFCFDDLKGVTKFDNTGIDSIFDCDNLKITNAIFCILWGHIFDLQDGDMGSWTIRAKYRGDTINTFNTLFGNSDNGEFAPRAKWHKLNEDHNLWNKIENFYKDYHKIGNFILIQNIDNINCARNFRFADYFDDFLLDIWEYQNGNLNEKVKDNLKNYNLTGQKSDDKKIKKYEEFCKALDNNPFYKNNNFFKILREDFYLEDYIDSNFKPFKVFTSVDNRDVGYLNYCNKNGYKELVKEYLDKAKRIIDKRSLKIIDTIKIELAS